MRTSRSSSTSTGNLVGRLAREHAPERDARAASGRPRGISTKPGLRHGRPGRTAPSRQLPRTISTAVMQHRRPSGDEAARRRLAPARRCAPRAAAPRRSRARAATPTSTSPGARLVEHEQVDRGSSAARTQDARLIRPPPASTSAASWLSASSGSGHTPAASTSSASAATSACCGQRAAPCPSARRARSRTGRSGTRRRTTARCRGRAARSAPGSSDRRAEQLELADEPGRGRDARRR